MTMTSQQIQGRIAYTAPELQRLGSLEEVTLGHKTGSKTDAYFGIGTPHSSVTFS